MFLFLIYDLSSEAIVWKRSIAHWLMMIFWADFQLIIIGCFPIEPSEILHGVTLPVQPTLFTLSADGKKLCLCFHSYFRKKNAHDSHLSFEELLIVSLLSNGKSQHNIVLFFPKGSVNIFPLLLFP